MAANLCRQFLLRNTLTTARSVGGASVHTSKAVRATDAETHTGQKWDEDDVRCARFMWKQKQINKQFAIDLIKEAPIIKVNTRVISCSGPGNPALGHPKVYINLDTHEPVACPYCGQLYQYIGDEIIVPAMKLKKSDEEEK